MKLYLVRHGQTDYNMKGLMMGVSDIQLNDTGKKQALNLAREIKERGLDFDIYYTSPLSRARETAEIITDGKASFIVDDLLIERNFGELEGKKVDWEKFGDDLDRRINLNTCGIEPIRDLLARAKAFLDKVIATHPDDSRILIVSHGTLLKALHYNIVGYDDDTDFRTFRMQNCEMREYEV